MKKALNTKSFYGANDAGLAPEIDMPPLNETPPIQTAAPDPWSNAPQSANIMAPVPDEVPADVIQAMQTAETDETQEPAAEQVEEIIENNPTVVTKPDTSAANLKTMREAREKAERQRDELMQLLQMQMQQQNRPQQQVYEEPEPEDDLGIEDDALAEGKHVRQVTKQVRALQKQNRELQKQFQQYQAQSSESITEARLKARYADFDNVVSIQNIEALRNQYPEIANTIHSTADLYSKGVSAYTLIKQFGIHKDPVAMAIDNDRLRAAKNLTKPRPLASVNPQQGDSPMSKANAFANGEFTPEMKQQLLREMHEARKNR